MRIETDPSLKVPISRNRPHNLSGKRSLSALATGSGKDPGMTLTIASLSSL